MPLTPQELSKYIFPGSVLRLSNSHIHSVDPHYHVILNKTPLEDSDIVMAVASTKVDKRQRHARLNGISLSTMPVFDNAQCSFLSEKSIFDCNSLVVYTLNSLYEKYYAGEWEIREGYRVSTEVLTSLKEATMKGSSPQDLKEFL